MDKYIKLFDDITKMIIWAEDQRHINNDQKELLIDNIIRIKEDIDNQT